mmetsp:Transcript_39997/g.76705  ORF Transcript_39997/g.76705 Transcript_39997/m.76705 type:complete len:291 (-) Transcript_39997:17-889(-)
MSSIKSGLPEADSHIDRNSSFACSCCSCANWRFSASRCFHETSFRDGFLVLAAKGALIGLSVATLAVCCRPRMIACASFSRRKLSPAWPSARLFFRHSLTFSSMVGPLSSLTRERVRLHTFLWKSAKHSWRLASKSSCNLLGEGGRNPCSKGLLEVGDRECSDLHGEFVLRAQWSTDDSGTVKVCSPVFEKPGCSWFAICASACCSNGSMRKSLNCCRCSKGSNSRVDATSEALLAAPVAATSKVHVPNVQASNERNSAWASAVAQSGTGSSAGSAAVGPSGLMPQGAAP